MTIVKTFVEEKQDWWDQISTDQQQAIYKSLKEMNEGKLTSHNEVMEKYKQWMKK